MLASVLCVSGPSANCRVKVGEVSSKNTFGMVGGIVYYEEEELSKNHSSICVI